MNDTTDSPDKRDTGFLYEMGRIFTREREISAMLDRALENLASFYGIVRGMINIYDEETGDIVIDVSYGYSDDEVKKGVYRLGEGIIGSVVSSGEPMVVHDVVEEPRFLDRTEARKSGKQGISFICVPVKLSGSTIGTISVDLPRREGEYAEELRVLTTLSVMIAHAVSARREMLRREKQLKDENRLLQLKLSMQAGDRKIVGETPLLKELHEQILMVAETDSTVLITGESGTGKELVADAIHGNSGRRDRAFVKVNIAALPENLIESELFGFEKGAFTGALQRRKGRFEMADGGTIFLDEIGDLNQRFQVHLLRVLQERSIERIGGSDTIPLDVRIIAATNQDLSKKISDKSFREDLFYRLNVFPIYIPPLRERRADIVLLADHFLEKFSNRHGKDIKRLSTDSIDLLVQYHWPGNIRELENCIERAVILCRENVIRNYHLPPSLQIAEDPGRPLTLDEMSDRFIKEIIIDHLKMNGGNITRAAQQLGTTKRILSYRISRLGIDYLKFKV